MPEHVHLIPVPNSMSGPSAFSSRNIPSQVAASRTTLCPIFSPLQKTRVLWLSVGEGMVILALFVLIQYQRVTNHRPVGLYILYSYTSA